MEDIGLKLESARIEDMGSAKRMVVDKDKTTIIGGTSKKGDIQGRIGQLKQEIEDTTSDYDKEKLQERLAKLAGGVAVINVGAATETEMKEKKARVEDALHATRAAVEEGIVPGGGVAYIRCQKALDALAATYEGDLRIGVNIIRRALEQPLRTLCDNAGVEGSVIVEAVKKEKKYFGYNVDTEEMVDMFEAGVIDPTKVTHGAAERGVGGEPALDDRSADHGDPGEKEVAGQPGWRRRRRIRRRGLLGDVAPGQHQRTRTPSGDFPPGRFAWGAGVNQAEPTAVSCSR